MGLSKLERRQRIQKRIRKVHQCAKNTAHAVNREDVERIVDFQCVAHHVHGLLA